jgi:hypothetical protein
MDVGNVGSVHQGDDDEADGRTMGKCVSVCVRVLRRFVGERRRLFLYYTLYTGQWNQSISALILVSWNSFLCVWMK